MQQGVLNPTISDWDPRKDPYGVGMPADIAFTPQEEFAIEQGSYGLGLAVGVFTGLIGVGLVAIFGKQDTKRGALHGFLAIVGLNLLLLLAS